eukprot:gene43885-53660_t
MASHFGKSGNEEGSDIVFFLSCFFKTDLPVWPSNMPKNWVSGKDAMEEKVQKLEQMDFGMRLLCDECKRSVIEAMKEGVEDGDVD